MNYRELILECKEKYDVDDKIIEYMARYYLKLNENDILNNIFIEEHKKDLFIEKLIQIKSGKPIQYVLGYVNFYGYDYKVTPSVLIPRFETEELVYYTKEYISKYFGEEPSIIDLGTGSGAIGLTLKKEIPNASVTLVDISDQALEIATKNTELSKVDVKIYKSDMLDEIIKLNQKYDVIISNPPYIREDEEIMDVVKNNEPLLALYGGKDGLKFYEQILSSSKQVLNDRALIAFEIGADQATEICKIALKYFKDCKYEIKDDLGGRNRMFFLFYNLID